MTQTNNSDDSSSKTLMNRRNVLAAIGSVTVGTALAADQFGLDFSQGDGIGADQPPLNESDADPDSDTPEFQTPWTKDTLVVSHEFTEGSGSNFLSQYGYDELQNAVAFWNDNIDANAAFDLTPTFERNADDPDILLKTETAYIRGSGEYSSPVSQNQDLSKAVLVETLRETPEENTDDLLSSSDLPVTATLGMGQGGRNVYRLFAQHALGRLLGYDIWSDPVSVMNPKILIRPANQPKEGDNIYHWLVNAFDNLNSIPQVIDGHLNHLQHPSNDTYQALEKARQTLQNQWNRIVTNSFEPFLSEVDEIGIDLYAEAYRETIKNEDLQYIDETNALIDEVRETYTQEELATGPDELDVIVDRIETIINWPETAEPYDVRVHRYFTDAVWSAWAAEQTPTATESDSA